MVDGLKALLDRLIDHKLSINTLKMKGIDCANQPVTKARCAITVHPHDVIVIAWPLSLEESGAPAAGGMRRKRRTDLPRVRRDKDGNPLCDEPIRNPF